MGAVVLADFSSKLTNVKFTVVHIMIPIDGVSVNPLAGVGDRYNNSFHPFDVRMNI